MSNFADWTPVTYVNESAPNINAPNLNKNEIAIGKSMNELNTYNAANLKDYIDYFMNNSVQEIHNFELATDFSSIGALTPAQARGTGVIFGTGGVTMQTTSSSASSIGIADTITSIDLTKYPSGVSAGSDDYITFCLYISDSSKVASLLLRLGDDDTNCFYKFLYSWTTGWNFIKYKKTEFGTDGTPSGWDDITFVRIYVGVTAGATSSYVICNKLWMSRKESGGSIASPIYVTDGAGSYNTYSYFQGRGNLVAYFDKQVGKKGIHTSERFSYDMLKVMTDVNSFSMRCEVYTKMDEDGFCVQWYVNSSNYILVLSRGQSFSIRECVNGVLSYAAATVLDSTIEAGDRLEVWVEKTADNIVRARLEIDGQTPAYVEVPLNITSTSSGDLGIWAAIDQYFLVTDIVASNNPSVPLPYFSNSLQKMVVKHYHESLTLTTTLQNDDELFIKLPSNSLFEVELISICSAASGTPDIKYAWVATGDYEVFSDGRVTISAATTMGSFSDIPLYMNNYGLATEVSTGLFSGGETPYYEKILIKTGSSGCKLQLQWSPVNSTSDYARVNKGSYIRATKL